jgi:hypothetical protein
VKKMDPAGKLSALVDVLNAIFTSTHGWVLMLRPPTVVGPFRLTVVPLDEMLNPVATLLPVAAPAFTIETLVIDTPVAFLSAKVPVALLPLLGLFGASEP